MKPEQTPHSSPSLQACRSPVLMCHGLPGDLILAVPTLRALLHLFGDRLLLVCGREPFQQEFFQLLGFQRRIVIDFKAVPGPDQQGDENWFNAWSFDLHALLPQVQGADALINLCFESSPPFDELARRLDVPSIGFHEASSFPRLLADQPLGTSAWDRCFSAVLQIDPTSAFNNFAWMPRHPNGRQIREAIVGQVGGGALLVVHADTKPQKMWPLRNWKQLLGQLLEEDPGLHIVMVGFPDIPFDRYGDNERLIDCRHFNLMASFEIVGMADWFIGIDSCMLHAADLARVPGVGLFTHEFPAWNYGFRFSFSRALQGANPPDDISVESVKRAFDTLRTQVEAERPTTQG